MLINIKGILATIDLLEDYIVPYKVTTHITRLFFNYACVNMVQIRYLWHFELFAA